MNGSVLALLTCCLILLISSTVNAASVIYDTGNTQPISDYMPKKRVQEVNPRKEVKPSRMNILPISTQAMTPGKVEARSHRMAHFQVPLFIFGSDSLSREWLVQRKSQLMELKAVGMLVQAATEQDLREMKALTEGLWVFPASGDDVGKELNLKHYPALISKIGIEQ